MKTRKINPTAVNEYTRGIEMQGIGTDEPWMRFAGKAGKRSLFLGAFESTLRSTGGVIPVPDTIFEPSRVDEILSILGNNNTL